MRTTIKQLESQLQEATKAQTFLTDELNFVRENYYRLETQLQADGWMKMGVDWGRKSQFSVEFVRETIARSKAYFLLNPLIQRAVSVHSHYVWALGCTITANHPEVQKVIDNFLRDRKNRCELGSREAQVKLDMDQSVEGNKFWMFFTDQTTGHVRLRSIHIDTVNEIETSPDDYKEVRWYRRVISNDNGTNERVVWHPDFWYRPPKDSIPPPKGFKKGDSIDLDHPIYHVKTGNVSDGKFGLPEFMSALAWADAYRKFLENWCTIMAAYARLAGTLSVGGKKNIPEGKAKMEQGLGGTTNSMASAAGFMISAGGAEFKAIKTAGSTTGGEEGYPVKQMVAAGTGLPGTFFGDADVGNFATSETLDRPTELKMVLRQAVWAEHFHNILTYVVEMAAVAPNGPLNGLATTLRVVDPIDGYENWDVVWNLADEQGNRMELTITVDFPDILERKVADQVRAIIGALTYNGRPPTDVIPDRRFHAEQLLKVMGVKNPKRYIDKWFPPGEEVPPIPPPDFGGGGDDEEEEGTPTPKRSKTSGKKEKRRGA